MLFLSVVIGLILRLINLIKYDLWFDEIAPLLGFIVCGSRIPPYFLYNLFLQYWQFFGRSELVLRLSSVCFGVASILMIYLLAKKLFNAKVAYISAFLLSISPLHIYYSQELRMYSLVVFFVMLSTYLFIKAIEGHSCRYWIGNVFFNCVSIYLCYSSILLIFAQFVYLIFVIKKLKNHFYVLLLFQAIQFVLMVVWFYICIWPEFNSAVSGIRIAPFADSTSFFNILYTIKNFGVGYYASNAVRTISAVISIAMLLKAFAVLLRENKQKMLLFLLFFLFPIVTLLLFSFYSKTFVYSDRYVIFCLPFFYILIGFCISKMRLKILMLAVVIISILSICSLKNFYSNNMESPYWEREGVVKRKEFKKAAEFIRQNYEKGDLVTHTCEVSSLPVEYYLDQTDSKIMFNRKRWQTADFLIKVHIATCGLTGAQRLIIHDPEKHTFSLYKTISELMAQKNSKLVESSKRVWLIDSGWGDYYFEEFNQWFNQRYNLLTMEEFNGVKLFLYQTNQ